MDNGLIVNGVPLLAVVIGLVEVSKKLGVSGNVSVLVSVALGVLLALGYQAGQLYPVFGVWYGAAITGLALGLAACGLYDLVNKRWPKV